MRVGILPRILTKLANNESVVYKFVEWSGREYKNGKLNKDTVVILSTGKEIAQHKVITNLDVLKKHLPVAISLWFASLGFFNTAKSKKIPSERKPMLITNSAVSDVIGIACGYMFNEKMDNFIDKIKPELEERLKKPTFKYSEAQQKLILDGFKSVVPLFAFTFTFRLLAPIVATPISNQLDKFLVKHGVIPDPEKKKKAS